MLENENIYIYINLLENLLLEIDEEDDWEPVHSIVVPTLPCERGSLIMHKISCGRSM